MELRLIKDVVFISLPWSIQETNIYLIPKS